MKKRPTLADVAGVCGYSLSTVDRVLNARAPVREETARRVFDAAEAIGYPLDARTPAGPQGVNGRRLGFLLLDPVQPFYEDLGRQLEIAATEAEPRPAMRIEYVRDRSPDAIAAQIERLAADCDRLAVTCYEHPRINHAIEDAERRGTSVTALLSPLGTMPTRGYMGLDNRQVGRTAGWCLTHFGRQPGKVGIFVGSHRFIGHEMREMGFRSYCREHAPELEVLETRVSNDDPGIAYAGTLDLLRRHPDLRGLYVAGGGMEGVIRALRDTDTRGPFVITQELTADSRRALLDHRISLVIATPLRQLATELIRQMQPDEIQAQSIQSTLPCLLYTPENC